MKKYLVGVLFLFTVFLVGCSEQQSDEEQIKAQIQLLQQAIENHSRSDFMSVIGEQYYDRLNSDRKSLQRMLIGYFLRYKDISVFVSATQVELIQTRAEAKSQVVITGGKGLIPEDARHYEVKSCWKKDSGEWFLTCLEWE